MQSEILFKAKRNGEYVNNWVEGYYVHSPILGKHEIFSFNDNRRIIFEVDPETVCQYTGLKDKKGVMIF